MTKLKAIPGGKGKERTFALLYGLCLYPTGDIDEVQENEITLTNGTRAQVPLHVIEGTHDQIRAQLLASIDAFFDIYGDTDMHITAPLCARLERGAGEPGC
jgi:hypothetical protein